MTEFEAIEKLMAYIFSSLCSQNLQLMLDTNSFQILLICLKSGNIMFSMKQSGARVEFIVKATKN